jgi:hypothetical protein
VVFIQDVVVVGLMSDVSAGLQAKSGCTLLNGIDSLRLRAPDVSKAFIAKPKEPY